MVRRGNGGGGYVWPQFTSESEAGNTKALVHGARSEREIAPLAAELESALLNDPHVPDYVRKPEFHSAVAAWARAEAMSAKLWDWLGTLDLVTLTTPRKAGTKSAVDIWRSVDGHAANLRGKLGLDPVNYARIAKDMGIAHKASEDALAQLAETGRAIREKRATELRAVGGGA